MDEGPGKVSKDRRGRPGGDSVPAAPTAGEQHAVEGQAAQAERLHDIRLPTGDLSANAHQPETVELFIRRPSRLVEKAAEALSQRQQFQLSFQGIVNLLWPRKDLTATAAHVRQYFGDSWNVQVETSKSLADGYATLPGLSSHDPTNWAEVLAEKFAMPVELFSPDLKMKPSLRGPARVLAKLVNRDDQQVLLINERLLLSEDLGARNRLLSAIYLEVKAHQYCQNHPEEYAQAKKIVPPQGKFSREIGVQGGGSSEPDRHNMQEHLARMIVGVTHFSKEAQAKFENFTSLPIFPVDEILRSTTIDADSALLLNQAYQTAKRFYWGASERFVAATRLAGQLTKLEMPAEVVAAGFLAYVPDEDLAGLRDEEWCRPALKYLDVIRPLRDETEYFVPEAPDDWDVPEYSPHYAQNRMLQALNDRAGDTSKTLVDPGYAFAILASIRLQDLTALTPLDNDERVTKLSNDISIIISPLAERLGMDHLAEKLNSQVMKSIHPERDAIVEESKYQVTGMNRLQRERWRSEQVGKLESELRVKYGLSEDEFSVGSREKSNYSAYVKSEADIDEGERAGKFRGDCSNQADLLAFRVILNLPEGDTRITQIMRDLHAALSGEHAERKRIAGPTLHDNIRAKTANAEFLFELQIMTSDFYSTAYRSGGSEEQFSDPHWGYKQQRYLRRALIDAGLPAEKVNKLEIGTQKTDPLLGDSLSENFAGIIDGFKDYIHVKVDGFGEPKSKTKFLRLPVNSIGADLLYRLAGQDAQYYVVERVYRDGIESVPVSPLVTLNPDWQYRIRPLMSSDSPDTRLGNMDEDEINEKVRCLRARVVTLAPRSREMRHQLVDLGAKMMSEEFGANSLAEDDFQKEVVKPMLKRYGLEGVDELLLAIGMPEINNPLGTSFDSSQEEEVDYDSTEVRNRPLPLIAQIRSWVDSRYDTMRVPEMDTDEGKLAIEIGSQSPKVISELIAESFKSRLPVKTVTAKGPIPNSTWLVELDVGLIPPDLLGSKMVNLQRALEGKRIRRGGHSFDPDAHRRELTLEIPASLPAYEELLKQLKELRIGVAALDYRINPMNRGINALSSLSANEDVPIIGQLKLVLIGPGSHSSVIDGANRERISFDILERVRKIVGVRDVKLEDL